ncbi:hypothetical protein [Candidatus Palauibacter sp.]
MTRGDRSIAGSLEELVTVVRDRINQYNQVRRYFSETRAPPEDR